MGGPFGDAPAQRARESAALVRALTALFKELDADGSGGVSAAELAAGLARLGYDVSGAEAAQLLEGADANRDGALQVRLFVCWVLGCLEFVLNFLQSNSVFI